MITESGVLTFDPVLHEYRVDGIIKRSVTGIIQDAGLVDTKWFTEESRQRGSAVHHGVRLLLEGKKLDPKTIDPRIIGYIKAAERFIEDACLQTVGVEISLYHDLLDYCGTMDVVGHLWLAGRGYSAIIDWKTGPVPGMDKISPEALQLAFYKMLWENNYPRDITERPGLEIRSGLEIEKRIGVHLEKNGGYKIVSFIHDERDEQEARKLLQEAA